MRETTLLADRVDSLTRGAADAMTRRSSVRALSAAVIIAAATGVPAVAKKGKKGKKCKRSTETCEAAITAACRIRLAAKDRVRGKSCRAKW